MDAMKCIILGLLISFSANASVEDSARRIFNTCEDLAVKEESWWTSKEVLYNTCVHEAKVGVYRKVLQKLGEKDLVLRQLYVKGPRADRPVYRAEQVKNTQNIERFQNYIRVAPSWFKKGKYAGADVHETKEVVERFLKYEFEGLELISADQKHWAQVLKSL